MNIINWLKNIFGEKKKSQAFKAVKDGDNISLYDQKTLEYLASRLSNPTQQAFSRLIAPAAKIVISKTETDENRTEKVPITINGITTEIEGNPVVQVRILEIADTGEVQAAKKKFEILDESKGHYMSVGNYLFDFIDKQGNSIQVEYLRGGSLRVEKVFKNDAELKKPLEFLNWLASLGISEPLNWWMEDDERRKENERRMSEWKSAAPKTLLRSMDLVNYNPFGPMDEKLIKELKSEIPDEKELVLKLFKLYGTGFYRWNGGVPVYEIIPADILMGINIEFLNTAFETADLDKEHKEGMARFLSSWDFSQKRKQDISQVSREGKNKLLAHLEEMGNEEKIRLFKKSLEE